MIRQQVVSLYYGFLSIEWTESKKKELWGYDDVERLKNYHGKFSALCIVLKQNLSVLYHRLLFRYWEGKSVDWPLQKLFKGTTWMDRTYRFKPGSFPRIKDPIYINNDRGTNILYKWIKDYEKQ